MNQTKTVAEVQSELEDVSWSLLINEPFYGHIISSISRNVVEKDNSTECSEIRSLGLSTVSLDIIKDKWLKLDKKQKELRFKHEVLHYIFMHPWAETPNNKGLFYTACDLSVNMHVDDSCSLNLSHFKSLSNTYKVSIDTKDGWFSIYNSLESLLQGIRNQVTDKDKIQEFTEKALKGEWFNKDKTSLIESIAFLPQSGSGDPNISGMSQELQDMMDPSTGEGQASDEEIEEFIKKNLSSDLWDDVKQGTSDLGAQSVIGNALKDAKSRGDVPGGLQDYVDMFLAPPKIDWRKEARNFTSLCGNVEARTTMTRRSKRYKTFPSLKIKRTQRIAICVDTSGSVSDEEFQDFMSEMRGVLQNNCEVIFIQADAVVDSVEIFTKKIPEVCRVMRTGGGGTAFDDALEYVKTRGRLEKHSHLPKIGKVDGVIYMTDGYAPAPERTSLPLSKLMWITTQKPVDQMQQEGFTGKIVLLDKED